MPLPHPTPRVPSPYPCFFHPSPPPSLPLQLTPEELRFLVTRQLRLVADDDPWADQAAFLTEVMLATYERRKPQGEVVNEMPLYPTEAVLFDENQLPSVHYTSG